MLFNNSVTTARHLAEVRSLGSWVENLAGEVGFQTGHPLRQDLPQLVSQVLLCGFKMTWGFLLSHLFLNFPPPCSSFVAGATGNWNTFLWATSPVWLCPVGPVMGTALFVHYNLQACFLHRPSKDGFTHLHLILQVASANWSTSHIQPWAWVSTIWHLRVNAVLHNHWPITYGETPEGILGCLPHGPLGGLRESGLIGLSTSRTQLTIVNPPASPHPKESINNKSNSAFSRRVKGTGICCPSPPLRHIQISTKIHPHTHTPPPPPPPQMWITERQNGAALPFCAFTHYVP